MARVDSKKIIDSSVVMAVRVSEVMTGGRRL